jgi:adenine deaminase
MDFESRRKLTATLGGDAKRYQHVIFSLSSLVPATLAFPKSGCSMEMGITELTYRWQKVSSPSELMHVYSIMHLQWLFLLDYG